MDFTGSGMGFKNPIARYLNGFLSFQHAF